MPYIGKVKQIFRFQVFVIFDTFICCPLKPSESKRTTGFPLLNFNLKTLAFKLGVFKKFAIHRNTIAVCGSCYRL